MFDNYHFFGCSWTAWQKNNYVKELARLLPNKKFYNWAVSGTSINLATYILDYVRKQFPDDNNCFIFQVTNYGRVTGWEENYEPNIISETANYYRLVDPMGSKNVYGFTSTSINGFTSSSIKGDKNYSKFKDYYYKYTSKNTMKHEHLVQCNYAKENSNFMFFHMQKPHNAFEGIETLKEVIGEKQYKRFVKEDDKHHFGPSGCKWQAEWLMKKDIFKDVEIK